MRCSKVNSPRDYEKEYTACADHRARRRLGVDVDRGEGTRFVVQLEYLIDPRTEHIEEVDGYVEEWLDGKTKDEVMNILFEANVPSAPSRQSKKSLMILTLNTGT